MLLSKSIVFCNILYVSVIIFRNCNMTSNLYVDVMSLLKQVITTIFYIIMIKIEFIIMSDRYYVSCHVEVLHAGNFLREKLLLHIFYKLPPLSQGPQGVAIALLHYCHNNHRITLKFQLRLSAIC